MKKNKLVATENRSAIPSMYTTGEIPKVAASPKIIHIPKNSINDQKTIKLAMNLVCGFFFLT